MDSALYIPKKIRVGYQKREGTYTKKLAYIIYFDDKGVLRKQTSWESWRDKTIEPEEFDNTPQDGFVLNKSIARYNWSHYSSGRSYIRIYDPRGIEFEVTPENLIGILMNTNCNKRGLDGKFVYAWSGKDLLLLPTECEEYDKSVNFTKLQAQKISAKDLVPGCSYKTKQQKDFIYVGRFHWYSMDFYGSKKKSRLGKKYHIFTRDGKSFETKSDLKFLAQKNSDEIVSNYAEIVENFKNDIHSGKIVKFEVVPCQFDTSSKEQEYYQGREVLLKRTYYKIDGNTLSEYCFQLEYKYEHPAVPGENGKHVKTGYSKASGYTMDIEKQICIEKTHTSYYRQSYTGYPNPDLEFQENQINQMGLGDLFITLDNGKRIQVTNLYNLQ